MLAGGTLNFQVLSQISRIEKKHLNFDSCEDIPMPTKQKMHNFSFEQQNSQQSIKSFHSEKQYFENEFQSFSESGYYHNNSKG